MASPRLNVSVTALVPKDLNSLDDLVLGLKTLASAHDVEWSKVQTYFTKSENGTVRLDAYYSTPAVV